MTRRRFWIEGNGWVNSCLECMVSRVGLPLKLEPTSVRYQGLTETGVEREMSSKRMDDKFVEGRWA